MVSPQVKICHFFLKNKCIYGDSCKNIHQISETNGPPIYNERKSAFNNNNYDNHNNNQTYNNNNNNNINTNIPNSKFSNNKSKIPSLCKFFTTEKGCTNNKCTFPHNYHDSLHHIKRDDIFKTNTIIVGCVAISKFFKVRPK